MTMLEILDRFEKTLECAYEYPRPEDRAVFYLGALEALRTVKDCGHSPEMVAHFIASRAQQATGEFLRLPWYRKIFR